MITVRGFIPACASGAAAWSVRGGLCAGGAPAGTSGEPAAHLGGRRRPLPASAFAGPVGYRGPLTRHSV